MGLAFNNFRSKQTPAPKNELVAIHPKLTTYSRTRQAFQSGQMSQRQITRKYGIGRPTILAWQKKYGNLEKNYLKMGEKTPQQEIVELKAALRAAYAENKTLKYIMEILQEEYGEEVVKKYLPGLQLEKPLKKKTKSK